MLKKSPENADGRTDGRTDGQTDGRTLPRHNTSRFSNGRIKINASQRGFVIDFFLLTVGLDACPTDVMCEFVVNNVDYNIAFSQIYSLPAYW